MSECGAAIYWNDLTKHAEAAAASIEDVMTLPTMRRRLLPILATFAAAALGGCAGNAVVNNSYQDYGYVPAEWRGNDVPVLVRGSPFAIPQSETDQAVRDAMQGTTFGVQTRFVAPEPDRRPAYRVVMMFGPPTGTNGYALCAGEPPSASFGAAPAPRTPVLAAFCRGDRAITVADGSMPTAGGPASPEFRRAVADFAVVLFPGRNNDRGTNPRTNG